jgi:mevalonate kinase
VSAPGKVILFGEHAVVHGYTALAASLSSLRTYARFVVSPAKEEAHITVEFANLNYTASWSHDAIEPLRAHLSPDNVSPMQMGGDPNTALVKALETFLQYGDSPVAGAKAALVFLYLYLHLAATTLIEQKRTLCVRVTSDIPTGAGLGSSASFAVCCAAGLLHLARQESQQETPNLDVVNRWALEAEKILHGTPSGIDNTISTFGKYTLLPYHCKCALV